MINNINNLLPHLHYFWLVAKSGSFTQAAEQLEVSQSAVSYQIKKLEEKLEVTLFTRDTRHRARLTNEGEILAEHCQVVFKDLENAVSSLSGDPNKGRITITAPTAFGSLIIAPALKPLKDLYPELDINLIITDDVLDFFTHSVDLAIRSSHHVTGLEGQLLVKLRKYLVASTTYLAKTPTVKTLDDLHHHRLIIRDSIDTHWTNVIDLFPGAKRPEFAEVVKISNNFGMVEAARAGLGMCLVPAYMIADDLREGKMQTILPHIFGKIESHYYACYPPGVHVNQKVSNIMHYLRDYLTQPRLQNAIEVATT
jgi:DNA-binding transcriptional LysR family regulator